MMPVPVIRFTKSMTPAERLQSLNKMRDWCQSPEANESKTTTTVLIHIINYAAKHLAVTSRLQFMSVDQANDLDCQVCEGIFYHADLPELLFLQHVINQINKIPDDSHPMKDEILPIVKQNKNTLMIPIIQETRVACGGAVILSLWSRFGWCLIASLLAILCSEQITNLRVAQSLKNRIALKETGGKQARIEDGYDGVVSSISNFTKKSYATASTLFNTVVLPAIQAEKKDMPRPSLR
jgi:hypothetical protein